MHAVIKLKPARDKPVANQHPWIFSGAINSVKGAPAAGDIVTVVSSSDRFLGRGYWNPASQIQVRMLTWQDEAIDDDWWRTRIMQSIKARSHLAESTDAYRLVNAENDFLPGLTIDRYASHAVLQAQTFGIDVHKWRIAEILREIPGIDGVYERSDADVRDREGLAASTGVLTGAAPPELIEINEGPHFFVDIVRGHKTGFYLDQRENRRLGRKLATELSEGQDACDFLNLFCYTGGFSLHAMASRARVTNVDSSADALTLAERNTRHAWPAGEARFVEADAFVWLRAAVKAGEQYDIVVLDPPKFAQNKQQLDAACRGYKDLNLSAFKLVRSGGYLLTFSCSGAMSADLFQKVVFGALADSGRQGQLLRHLGPGVDHPVALTFPEGAYLKGLLVRVL